MDRLISEQAVIDRITRWYSDMLETGKEQEDLIEVIKAIPSAEPKWIPVSERLPEINEWVVCQCRANIYEVLKFTSYGWYHDDAHCYMDGFVIAWMPLPIPYKAESEE